MHARDGAPFDRPALSGREEHKHILGMDLAAQFGELCQLPAAICARPAILARAYSSSLSPGMRLKVVGHEGILATGCCQISDAPGNCLYEVCTGSS